MTLPELVGLCPDPNHTGEFYVPHGGRCPQPGCTRELVVYRREELPEALRLARRARMSPTPLKVASPSRLHHLAVKEHGVGDEATRLYRHAMIEAGYMVPGRPGEEFEPADPCPICNWSPNV